MFKEIHILILLFVIVLDKNMVPEVHESFLLNNKPYSNSSLEVYAHELIRSEKEYLRDVGDFLLDWLDDSLYINLQTSGSTGIPKLIRVKKEYMINSAKATGIFFKMREGSTALLCLSANYIAGKMMLVRAMVLGWKLDIVEPKSNPLDKLYRQYDFCAMVPLQLDNSIHRLHLLKKLIVGGGAVPEYLISLIQGISTKVYETYGMTETVSHIAARRLNSKKKSIEECFFKTLPQVVISTDDRNCLEVKAPLLSDTLLVTNDIVEIVTHKKFIWKGRFDNVINSGGVKLFPEQIEKKLQLVIRQRFFVSSIPDSLLGNKLILIVEDITGTLNQNLFAEKITQLSSLGKFERPKQIYFVNKFIETRSGKIIREDSKQLALQ